MYLHANDWKRKSFDNKHVMHVANTANNIRLGVHLACEDKMIEDFSIYALGMA